MFKRLNSIIKIIGILTVCIGNLMGIAVPNTVDTETLVESVQAANQARIEAGTITGAHCIVMQNGVPLLNETYGFDGVGGDALSEDAVYRIASMTKPITAVAMLIEQDRGHLNLNDDLAEYLPAFSEMYLAQRDENGDIVYDEFGLPAKGEKAEQSIKLYQLLSHYSGVGDANLDFTGGEQSTVESAVSWLASQPLMFEPGTAAMYSAGAFDIAAAVIEKTSGMDFAQYLKLNIFDRLGMTDTTFEPTEAQWGRLVKIHNIVEGVAVNDPGVNNCVFFSTPCTYHAAGTGLASTASDYAKFAQMLLNKGIGDNGARILSENAVKQLHTPVADDNGVYLRWGLGVCIIAHEGLNLPVGTYYWSSAYGSHFWVDPTNRITAVYMKNSIYDGGAGNQSASEFEAAVAGSFVPNKLRLFWDSVSAKYA